MVTNTPKMIQPWMRGLLLVGAVYNFAWAVFLFWKPDSYIKWMSQGLQEHNPWVAYQAAGIAAVGLMLFLSMLKPLKFRFLVFTAFLAKLFGGIAVYLLIMESVITKKFIFHLLMNDLVWVIPLFIISLNAFKADKNR